MAQIIIQRDPSKISSAEINQIAGKVNLLDWLCDNQPLDFDGLHCEFLLNGKLLCNTWEFEPEQCNELLDVWLAESDTITCVIRPAGDPLTTILIITAVLAAAVVIALTPKLNNVPVPGDSTSSQSNQLNSSTNTYLRIGDAIDDNAGQIVKTPKFLQRSYYEYDAAGRRIFTEYFLIGRGQYDAEQPKEGDTPFDTIPGYEYEYLPPGSHPTTLLNVSRNPSTTDIDVLASEQQRRSVYPNFGEVNNIIGRITLTTALINDLGISVGTQVYINLTCISEPPFSAEFFVIGFYQVAAVGSDWFEVTVNDFPDGGEIQSGIISNQEFQPTDTWYVLNGSAIEEVWFHVKMPSGIRKGDGTDGTVTFSMTIEELDATNTPTGNTFVKTGQFFGNTQSQQAATFKFTQADSIPISRYRAKINRTSATLGNNSIDLLVLDGIDAVTPYTPNWGDLTALKVVRASLQRVNKGASTKINCLITRKLQTFTSGATYVATRNFSDYAFYLLRDLSGVAVANIDTTTLFGIMSGLSDPQLGYFDYQFDDRNSSLRERLNICCNVARVRYYNEGLNWTFTREESRPSRMALFNRRNLKPESSQFVQKFRLPSSYDGVTLVYVDPVKNSEKRISKKILDGAFVDGLGENSFEFNLPGCRNSAQAINRLNLEVRRLIYQNVKVTDVSIGDALVLPLGERVDWVDVYDGEIFSGEIMGQKDTVFATSERFTPSVGVDYFVYVTDDDGVPTNTVACLPRSDGTLNGFEATGLSSFTGNQVFQVGSRYVIASSNDYDASAFTLIGKSAPNEQNEVRVELAEYNELLFADDEPKDIGVLASELASVSSFIDSTGFYSAADAAAADDAGIISQILSAGFVAAILDQPADLSIASSSVISAGIQDAQIIVFLTGGSVTPEFTWVIGLDKMNELSLSVSDTVLIEVTIRDNESNELLISSSATISSVFSNGFVTNEALIPSGYSTIVTGSIQKN